MAALDFPASPTVGQKYPSPAVTGVPVYSLGWREMDDAWRRNRQHRRVRRHSAARHGDRRSRVVNAVVARRSCPSTPSYRSDTRPDRLADIYRRPESTDACGWR